MPAVEGTERLFVAVLLPAPVREALGNLIERGKSKGTDVRWTRKENLHITLKFLGDVKRRDIPAVNEALREAASRVGGFGAAIRGLGAFPSAGRPRVLWAGIDQGAGELQALAAEVEACLQPLGFPSEGSFSGHVTLGRLRQPGPSPWFREWCAQERMEPLPVRVDGFWLMKSTLTPSGPEYEPLAEFRLGGAAAPRFGEGAED